MASYVDQLSEGARNRYREKLRLIEDVDPYSVSFVDMSAEPFNFPKTSYFDIVNYLVFERSAYTQEEFKNFKSLEAYNQYVCGWVEKVKTRKFSNCILVKATVLHSQRLREKSLTPWIIAKADGSILAAHCDCVAGLGETCTHVGAVLFHLDGIQRRLEEQTVTDVKAYWKVPSSSAAGVPDIVRKIDFTSASKLFKASKGEVALVDRSVKDERVAFSTPEEVQQVLQELSSKGFATSLHTIVRPFAGELSDRREAIVNVLSNLYKEEHEKLNLLQLCELGQNISFNLTEQDCKDIETKTKKQTQTASWFLFRLGRVTASKFKQCTRTKIEKPSMSLVEAICYPRKKIFGNKCTVYGCEHEDAAVEAFIQKLRRIHKDVQVHRVGFIINVKFPHVGASPDRMITCSCCKPKLLEVKCPYCAKDIGIEEAARLKKLCLTKCTEEKEEYYLPQDHQYYYQVQMQLAVAEIQAAYFVVWSKKDFYAEEIAFNLKFWEEKLPEITNFFHRVILPELFARYYTRQKQNLNVASITQTTELPADPANLLQENTTPAIELVCICRKPNDGSLMVACDSGYCRIEWFHAKCVGVTKVLTKMDKFYCNNCIDNM